MGEVTPPRRKAILEQLAGFQVKPRIAPPMPAKPDPVVPITAATEAVPAEVAVPPREKTVGSPPSAEVTTLMAKRHGGKASRARHRLAYHRAARARLRDALERHKAETAALRAVLVERYPAAAQAAATAQNRH